MTQPERIIPQFDLKDHMFFKSIGNYGQVVIPKDLRKTLHIDKEEDIYAMIVVIPLVTKVSSMTKEEAYEYLKLLIFNNNEFKCPKCGTPISCPCGLGLGT